MNARILPRPDDENKYNWEAAAEFPPTSGADAAAHSVRALDFPSVKCTDEPPPSVQTEEEIPDFPTVAESPDRSISKERVYNPSLYTPDELLSATPAIESAISDTAHRLPWWTGLFMFARRMYALALAGVIPADPTDHETHIREWSAAANPTTKEDGTLTPVSFDRVAVEYGKGYRRVMYPVGKGAFDAIVAALYHRPDRWPGIYPSPPRERLLALCRELGHLYQGKPFPLSGEKAAEACGFPNRERARNALAEFVRAGWLRNHSRPNALLAFRYTASPAIPEGRTPTPRPEPRTRAHARPKIPWSREYRPCTNSRPCPICGRKRWCAVAADGTHAVCMRVSAGAFKTVDQGHGIAYFHRLDTAPPTDTAPTVPTFTTPPAERWELDYPAILARWRSAADPQALQREAAALSLPVKALEQLGALWVTERNALGFPMRDGKGEVIGIRLRTREGAKFTLHGDHTGIFLPDPFPDAGPILIAEGPTDAAAGLALGYATIGRPSATGSRAYIRELVARYPGRRVIVIADADEVGQRGAADLIAHLADLADVAARPVTPPAPHKDLRAWSRADPRDVTARVEAARNAPAAPG